MSNSKIRRAFSGMQPEYDSDEDLTPSEQSMISRAADPDLAREQIWSEKPLTDKFVKTLKTIWHGDRSRKVKF